MLGLGTAVGMSCPDTGAGNILIRTRNGTRLGLEDTGLALQDCGGVGGLMYMKSSVGPNR